MNFDKIHKVYLIGIGGIGMSAIALYFKYKGKQVAGYDKTATPLTKSLEEKGIFVHFDESIDSLPSNFKIDKADTLLIYTPAIPVNHEGLRYLKQHDYKLYKRAEILGFISNKCQTIAVAGTHGKTSISTNTAYLFSKSTQGVIAFLGGISKNYQSNLVLPANNQKETVAVVEADEFDRSFLHLKPYIALISAIDADHLDIYSNKQNIVSAFNQFVDNIDKQGILVYKKSLELDTAKMPKSVYTYSLDEDADFRALNLKINNKLQYCFDLQTPNNVIKDLVVAVPGKLNAENAVAACSLAYLYGVNDQLIRENLLSFNGVKRRFDYRINTEKLVYIDDYAHHPEEITAFLRSVRAMYPKRKITAVFQPHLYSRTQDFAKEFADALNLADELILLDIYPAREQAIKGVSSELIYSNISIENKKMCTLNELTKVIEKENIEVLLTMGAGNIDTKVNEISKLLQVSSKNANFFVAAKI